MKQSSLFYAVLLLTITAFGQSKIDSINDNSQIQQNGVQTILNGNKSQTGIDRWGDYASMSIDPSDGTTFWFTTEWTNGGWSWKTQIASMTSIFYRE